MAHTDVTLLHKTNCVKCKTNGEIPKHTFQELPFKFQISCLVQKQYLQKYLAVAAFKPVYQCM